MTNQHSSLNLKQPHTWYKRSNSGAIGFLLCIGMLIWGTTGAAQTSEHPPALTVETANQESGIAITQSVSPENAADATGQKLPGNDVAAPIAEANADEPAPDQVPSRRPGRLTSAIERFTPTEEISADNAVPFPVDI